MKSINTLLVSLIFWVTFSGCHRMTIEAGIIKDIYLSRPHETSYSYTVIGEFKDSFKGSWLFWGLLSLKQPDLERALRKQIMRYNGDAVINLQLKTMYDPLDIIINYITVGIFNTRTVKITGHIIRFSPQGSLPINDEVIIVLNREERKLLAVCSDFIGKHTKIYFSFYPGL